MNKESDVIAAIDQLERDEIDDMVDWQMSDSAAAHTQQRQPLFMGSLVTPQGPSAILMRRIAEIVAVLESLGIHI